MIKSERKSRRRFEVLLEQRTKDNQLLKKLVQKSDTNRVITQQTVVKELELNSVQANEEALLTHKTGGGRADRKKKSSRTTQGTRRGNLARSQDLADPAMRKVQYQSKRAFFREMTKKRR